MERIIQVNCANHGVYPFLLNLKNRYNLVDYYDNTLPCFFWGVIGEENKINNHKGLKIVKFITPSDCERLDLLNESDDLYVINDPHFKTHKKYNFANLEIEFQDFSIFQPKILQDKIYCYMRDPVEFQKKILLNLQKKINFEILFGGEVGNAIYYDTLENHKKNFYDKCFVSINLSSKHGYTTVRELGLMGVRTIMKSPYNFSCILKLNSFSRNKNNVYIDENEIVELINEESKKIGTIQNSYNVHNIKDEWLISNFWKNNVYEKY